MRLSSGQWMEGVSWIRVGDRFWIQKIPPPCAYTTVVLLYHNQACFQSQSFFLFFGSPRRKPVR